MEQFCRPCPVSRCSGQQCSWICGEPARDGSASPVNEAVTTFLGDVFEYVSQKAENPGTIREAVLDALKEAEEATSDQDEPLVVVSHSMGGQVVFDIATNFLGPELWIDFWAATASQVGLFEKMKLLLASDFLIHGPQRAPFPPNVGWWWNVWDSNDVLSFTARDIFSSQVDDEEWDSGASLAAAHGAYLRRPSFTGNLQRKSKQLVESRDSTPHDANPSNRRTWLLAEPSMVRGYAGRFCTHHWRERISASSRRPEFIANGISSCVGAHGISFFRMA